MSCALLFVAVLVAALVPFGAMAFRIYHGLPWGDTRYCERDGCYATIGREHDACYNHRRQ